VQLADILSLHFLFKQKETRTEVEEEFFKKKTRKEAGAEIPFLYFISCEKENVLLVYSDSISKQPGQKTDVIWVAIAQRARIHGISRFDHRARKKFYVLGNVSTRTSDVHRSEKFSKPL